MMYRYYWDPTYIILLPALILSLYAQMKVQSTFSKYQRVRSSSGVTGAMLARSLLNDNGLGDVRVEQIGSRLGDHYDPRDRVIRLSPEVYNSTSIAALGVAAHETGHAIQHSTGYAPLNLRSSLVPVANFGSSMAMPLFFIGLILAQQTLITIGIMAFSAAVLFQIVTLPVEFNASRRALVMLQDGGYLANQEVRQARKVLGAAALTYVAATAVALMHLVRLLLISSQQRERR
jgi:Zn-dependent membrane protease YugP